MPAVTYLSDSEVRQFATVPDDKDCNELLQELRRATGENWIVGTYSVRRGRTPTDWALRRPAKVSRHYTLYADCHGEWQVINLVTPCGGSVFHGSEQSREDVMNYMLGVLNGLRTTTKVSPTTREG